MLFLEAGFKCKPPKPSCQIFKNVTFSVSVVAVPCSSSSARLKRQLWAISNTSRDVPMMIRALAVLLIQRGH